MSKVVSLDEYEFEREKKIFENNQFDKWQDLWPFFESNRYAGDPGFAGCELEYMYENDGDSVPTKPWVEYWINGIALEAIWEYFMNENSGDCIQYVNKILKSNVDFCFNNTYDLDDYNLSSR